MSSSELSEVSSLSSAESLETDEEILNPTARTGNLDAWLSRGAKAASPSPPPKKRAPSPPHEYVLADNPNIVFCVMFRARFSDAFPRSYPHLGPQDLERGIVDAVPDENVEKFLCCLIGLVLNRKKDVEKGHYGRALEEAVHSNQSQWPKEWQGQNPLHGGNSFNTLAPTARLDLLRALILWALNSSEAIQKIIKESYKQQRHEDDLNQPLGVQPWGRDGYKRRYWLIEGRDDTPFRIYRESNPALKTNTWWSVADSIESAKELAEKLKEEGSQAARRLHDQIYAAVPRFEAGEEKRKRREYRLARRAAFTRPEPGFSMYEGRTRGKRVKYTFSDNEDEGSDAQSTRRSTRISGVSTPAESAAPTVTASGRQVRSRVGGMYGESMHSGQQAEVDALRAAEDDRRASEEVDDERAAQGRTSRNGRSSRLQYNDVDAMDDESDASSSGNEWDGGDEDEAENNSADDDESESDGDRSSDDEDISQRSLLVSLKVSGSKQEAIMLANGETSRRSEPPLDSITVDKKRAAATPEAQTVPSKSEPGHGNEDEMDLSDHNVQTTPPSKAVTNGIQHSGPEQKMTNGVSTSNHPGLLSFEKFAPPLQRETKLPFSPPKRESPPKLIDQSHPPPHPASSAFTTPSTSNTSFVTPSQDASTTPTTQIDETQSKLMEASSAASQAPMQTEDVQMT